MSEWVEPVNRPWSTNQASPTRSREQCFFTLVAAGNYLPWLVNTRGPCLPRPPGALAGPVNRWIDEEVWTRCWERKLRVEALLVYPGAEMFQRSVVIRCEDAETWALKPDSKNLNSVASTYQLWAHCLNLFAAHFLCLQNERRRGWRVRRNSWV